jgi:signal transduction histidine kinase
VENIYLKTDSNMLNTVLGILLSNSKKFTCKFGKVFVAVIKETDNITILVKDNGVGISSLFNSPKINRIKLFIFNCFEHFSPFYV